MHWICKTALAGVMIAALVLMGGTEPSTALAQKGGGKKDTPQVKFERALDKALFHLKEAEKFVLQADLKELDLTNTNPKVVKRLTAAVQSVNKAHALTEKAKELSTTLTPAEKGKDKKP
jgi:hypothetical protein